MKQEPSPEALGLEAFSRLQTEAPLPATRGCPCSSGRPRGTPGSLLPPQPGLEVSSRTPAGAGARECQRTGRGEVKSRGASEIGPARAHREPPGTQRTRTIHNSPFGAPAPEGQSPWRSLWA